MESYIEDKKKLYSSIYEYLENCDDKYDEFSDESFHKLTNIIKNQQIENDREEMIYFLEIIKCIGENHHRNRYFNEKMNKILMHYKDQIMQTLQNIEIFNIFENNKNIVLFLLKNGFITISETICKMMICKLEANGLQYWYFFIPEIENLIDYEKMEYVKKELIKDNPRFFENFEKKRQEGENDSYICSLIRKDSVEEFISYVNRYNISLSSHIIPSIFETNQFLIDNKNTTLIEYSAFFGSIQIFRYLFMNEVEVSSSLWLYAIHSKNAEMIHLLESNEFLQSKYLNSSENYVQCYIESIKCHHNDIADYIENNLMVQNKNNSIQNEEIISNCIKYHNYLYFKIEMIIDYGFFYLYFYHYNKLVELLLKIQRKEIGWDIIFNINILIYQRFNYLVFNINNFLFDNIHQHIVLHSYIL